MPNFNKVILMGNLTRDPELRFTADRTPVCNLGLAVNRRYRTRQGDTAEEVCYVDCEAWGATGENLHKYLAKGRPVLLEGRLRLDEWEDRDRQKRSKLKLVVEHFQFVDGRPREEQTGSDQTENTGTQEPEACNTGEDSIPF